MEELEEENAICELFCVTPDVARDVLNKAGKSMREIKRFIEKRSRKTGKCKLCGKRLSDPDSVRRGYGPDCYEKVTAKDTIKLEV